MSLKVIGKIWYEREHNLGKNNNHKPFKYWLQFSIELPHANLETTSIKIDLSAVFLGPMMDLYIE